MALCYGEYAGRTVKGFIKYIIAKSEEKHITDSYRYYVTDCLMALSRAEKRWYDLLNPVDEGEQLQTALDNFYSDFKGKGDK